MRLGTGQAGATLVTCILRDGSPRPQADMCSSAVLIDRSGRASADPVQPPAELLARGHSLIIFPKARAAATGSSVPSGADFGG